jgi:endonuclease/exonuclease/phosphatase family metal-dependent hydrolase
MQINLQHSKVATDNLMKLIQQEHTDIVFVQEPYLYQNNTVGIRRTHRIYTPNEEKYRTAIIIANDNINPVFIKQLSDRDTAVTEIRYKSIRTLAASMHLDINEDIDKKTAKIDKILRFSKGIGILIAMDRNCKSTKWHDNCTNPRVKTLDEYLTSRNLHIMNKESEQTTFQSRRGRSNIDLTIVNNQLLKKFNDWKISEDESCSDHNIIKVKIVHENNHAPQHNHTGTRYIIKEQYARNSINP